MKRSLFEVALVWLIAMVVVAITAIYIQDTFRMLDSYFPKARILN